jgi:hypothetical protein
MRFGRYLAQSTFGVVEGELLFLLELALHFGEIYFGRCLTLHCALSLVKLDVDLNLGVIDGLDGAQVLIDDIVLGNRNASGLNVGKRRIETLVEGLEVFVVLEVHIAEIGKCSVLTVGVLWCT